MPDISWDRLCKWLVAALAVRVFGTDLWSVAAAMGV